MTNTPADAPAHHAIPSFAALRAFEAVGRLGGVRSAAAVLRVDHTVVSRHIKSLQDWLGIALFDRLQGQLAFTPAGEEYHRRVSAALAELASATSAIAEAPGLGNLKIWCVPGFAARWLSERLSEFQRLSPGLGIELRPTERPANLLLQEADIDVRYYGDDWSPAPGGKGLRFVELARPALMPVASPVLAERLSTIRHVTELAKAPLLHEEHEEQWRSWFRHNGVVIEGRLPGPLLWHAHLAVSAARRGDGIALANAYLLGHDLEDGSLVEIKIPGSRRAVIGSYCFVTTERRWSSPSVARLRRFLQAKAG